MFDKSAKYVEVDSIEYYKLSPNWVTWETFVLPNGVKIAKMVYVPQF